MARPRAAANPDRGEDELVLAGTTYILRPAHTALRAIETKTGKSVLALVRLGNSAELSLEQLGVIGAELIKAGAAEDDAMTRSVDAERIGELIFEEGLPQAISRFTLVLLDAATGGRTATGEAKAAPAPKRKGAGAA